MEDNIYVGGNFDLFFDIIFCAHHNSQYHLAVQCRIKIQISMTECPKQRWNNMRLFLLQRSIFDAAESASVLGLNLI